MSKIQEIARDELKERGYKKVQVHPWSGQTDRGDIEHWTHETKRSVFLVTFVEHGGWDLFCEVDMTRSSEGGSTFRQLDELNGEPL